MRIIRNGSLFDQEMRKPTPFFIFVRFGVVGYQHIRMVYSVLGSIDGDHKESGHASRHDGI